MSDLKNVGDKEYRAHQSQGGDAEVRLHELMPPREESCRVAYCYLLNEAKAIANALNEANGF